MIDSIISTNVAPETIWRYLESLGWRKDTSTDNRMLRFTLWQPESPIHLFFTIIPSEDTAKREIATAVSTLEQVYGISSSDILRASASVFFDLIKATIPDDYVRNDTINLKTASSFIHCLKEFLASSATTEASEERNFLRNSKASLDYANDCRFGHTFKGSFGFIIESPVGPNDEINMPFIEEQVPHGRKVIERISRSFRAIREAKLSNSISHITDPRNGISSNMCDDLISIIEDTGINKVKFSFDLSPEWSSSSSEIAETPFSVELKDVEMLREASTRIRGAFQPVAAVIMGMVSRLEMSGIIADIFDDRATREVIINWDSPDYGRIKVKVPLSTERYLDAIRAHSEGRPYLASGFLVKAGRTWVLIDVDEARVMN